MRTLSLTILLLLSVLSSKATHLVGGEIYYNYMGNNLYQIILKVYRDCGPTNTNNTQFDSQAPIGIYDANGNWVETLTLGNPNISTLPVVVNDPCLTAPPSLCIQEAIYQGATTLPPIAGGYDVVYERCCRNPSTLNIVNPQNEGATYHTHITSSTVAPGNSSPRFDNYPPLVLCADSPFTFDHSATDPDGDQLEYEFFQPYSGGSPTVPAPNPGGPPPFNTVTWAAGYSTNFPIQSNPAMSLDPNTGLLTGTPTLTGIFTVGVRVNEYRNGQLINSTYRDFQFFVTNCNPSLTADFEPQDEFCSGLTYDFTNLSTGAASFYEWHFGDGSTSTQTNPSHTYADTGTYSVTLIANPGWNCADTVTMDFTISNPINASFPEVAPQCISSNSFDFQAQGNITSNAAVDWDFGANATPSTSSSLNPQNVTYSDSGHYLVTLTVSQNGCTDSYTDTVDVVPIPEFGFLPPPQEGCEPYLAQFTDTSMSWTPLDYLWDFGDGTTSTDANPEHLYTAVGSYDVTVTISTDSVCPGQQTFVNPGMITVIPSPTAMFLIDPMETTVYDPFFEITDLSSGNIVDMYYLNDPDTLNNLEQNRWYIDDTGHVEVTQVVINDHGCEDRYTQTVYIEPFSSIYAPNAFTPNGDGKNDIWKPVARDLHSYTLRIYNRWGELIMTTTDTEAGWDGRQNGKLAPNDTYVYIIHYQPIDRIERTKRGHFTLVR